MDLTSEQEQVYLKYAELPLPRHTSYPSVPHWRQDWTPAAYGDALRTLGASRQAVGLYVHLPFCRQLCHYCACTREIVPDEKRHILDPVDDLLRGLALEARRVAQALGKPLMRELHLGGGTPTFLTPAQLARLSEILSANFVFAADAEMACEVDPRVTTAQHLQTLRGLGFNRLSLGVQDFDPAVQAAIGRQQSFDSVRRTVETARALGFPSISFDLIYGLPWQTEASLNATLDQVLSLAPDRVAFFRLAVLPELFKWQKTLKRGDLPHGLASLRLMQTAVRRFTEAGYLFMGLDHFVKGHDSLARAAAAGDLTRSFQGMAAGRGRATVALGPSGITQGDGFYSQSDKTSKTWRQAVEDGLSASRGLLLSADDQLRRGVLLELYADGEIDFAVFRARHGVDFLQFFAAQRPALRSLTDEGLITLNADRLTLTPTLGRLLVRVVAAALDRYLEPDAWRRGAALGQASAAG